MNSQPYDRTDLASVIAEYKRQATLPTIVLTAENMQAHARQELKVNAAIKQAEIIIMEGN
jgi:hypothetical protein